MVKTYDIKLRSLYSGLFYDELKKAWFFADVLSSTGHMSTQYHSNFLGFSAVKGKFEKAIGKKKPRA